MCEEWQMYRVDHDGRLIGLFTWRQAWVIWLFIVRHYQDPNNIFPRLRVRKIEDRKNIIFFSIDLVRDATIFGKGGLGQSLKGQQRLNTFS